MFFTRRSCDFYYNETMVEYEVVSHSKIKDINVFLNSIRMRSLHMHHDMELLLVIEGEGQILIKNKRYRVFQGDSILINAYESHEILSKGEPITFIIIQFSNHFLRDYFYAIRNAVFPDPMIRERFPEDKYCELVEDILSLSQIYLKEKELYELEVVNVFSKILHSLFTYMNVEELSESEYSKRKKVNRRIDRIAAQIDAAYTEQIRLADIAESEGITVTHLSHFIHDNFGMSFQEYLKEKRLGAAVRLIADPSVTLSDVASDSGFSELKYMTAAFKEVFGLTPQQYRQMGLQLSTENKKASAFEYIHSKEEALSLLNDIYASDLLS